jgi:hypothetical protein
MLHVVSFPLLKVLYFHIRSNKTVCVCVCVCAVLNVVVSCSALISRPPGALLRYFMNDFETVPAARNFTDVTAVFTPHTRCISVVRLLWL